MLSDHQRLHPFRGAEFLQCRAQVAAADVQHASGEVKQELGTWLRISMGRARGALQPPLACIGLAGPDERTAE